LKTPLGVLVVVIPLTTTLVLEPTTDAFGLVIVSILSALVVPCITPPNWIAPGENVTPASVPEPLVVTVAGLLLALLVTITLPVRVPCAVGLKVTPTVQLEPAIPLGARMVEPLRLQGFAPIVVSPKSPVVEKPVTVIPTELGFDTVSVSTVALVVPTWVLGNDWVNGERVIIPCTPLAVAVTTDGLLGALEGTLTAPV
jgi:hypothetical protein